MVGWLGRFYGILFGGYLICNTVLLYHINIYSKNVTYVQQNEFKVEIFGPVCRSYSYLCISIVPQVNQSVVNVCILDLAYNLTSSFVKIFSGLKLK